LFIQQAVAYALPICSLKLLYMPDCSEWSYPEKILTKSAAGIFCILGSTSPAPSHCLKYFANQVVLYLRSLRFLSSTALSSSCFSADYRSTQQGVAAKHRPLILFGSIDVEPALIVATLPANPICSSFDWTDLQWTIFSHNKETLPLRLLRAIGLVATLVVNVTTRSLLRVAIYKSIIKDQKPGLLWKSCHNEPGQLHAKCNPWPFALLEPFVIGCPAT